MSRQKDRTTNPTPYGKPYGKLTRTSSEKDARSVVLGRSLVM